MDSKKTHQLSKATIATVVAASGVLIAMPQPTNAYTFSDLNPHAFYYEPVTDLAKRNIATGYSNGTFLPNKAITREDAAKMLALAIDINITNPKNPRFKDVNANNPNYIYIAALSEEGIINGFTDNTFKPKEPITRAQMAKILTLGYKFGVSSKINNSFRDVSPSNFAAYYIQTLVDLNVTKGSSAVTFDPFKSVTRGEMATFIWRAQKADRGTPIYAVGDVSNDKIYINGVAHSIAPHLRSILNASNKNILKGAYIEGTYSGMTLTNITKLTLNASGTSSRLLALDGNYTSFAGELIINGSYVRMKDINFTGRVEVAEPPRRSLATLNNIRVASVTNMARFIDWGTPTDDKNEDFLNPEENQTLQDKPDPTKPSYLQKYTARMANIKAYVDFEGSDIRNLFVTADRAFVKSDTDIDRLTVQGDVTNFELYADAKAMYLDNDYNMTVYGVNDIQYVYKNSLKNVHFNTDSTYEYYYVTSKSGYTNIGTHAYITNAIIPPNTTVINIFDDFETDEPQVDWIEDENGTTVPRDPVGDTVIADVTSPEITQLAVKAGGTIADVTLTADEDGMYYYIVKKSTERPPTISEIKTGGVPLSGKGPVLMDEEVTFQVTELESKTEYTIYAIVIDGSDNVSDKEEREFSTIDARPPTIKLEPGAKMYGGKRVQFKVTPSEPGTIYYFIRPDSSAPKPTVDDVIEKNTGTIDAKTAGTITETVYKSGIKPNLADITPNTPYQIFAVMVDDSGNKMSLVEEIKITTEAPDTTNPKVAAPAELVLKDKAQGIFEFKVTEELDPDSALDEKNYILSGTGIINISGQKEINPSNVEIIGTTVRLTIPSITALVKNDTIRVTVSKNVKDLALNDFENESTVNTTIGEKPQNVASYVHEDDTLPTIKIDKVITENNERLLEVTTTKSGTYYYMILPENYDFTGKGITPRDFVDEFNATTKTGKFQDNGVNDYVVMKEGSADLGKNTLPLVILPEDLDPFTSYSIFIYLKDRAGLISRNYDSIRLVTDSKAPLVSSISVAAKSGSNKEVEFSINADEAGTLHTIAIPKYIKNPDTPDTEDYMLNSPYFDSSGKLRPIQGITSASKSEEQKIAFDALKSAPGAKVSERGTFAKDQAKVTVDGLEAHQEYGFYIGVSDNQKNFSVYMRENGTTPPPNNEPNGPQMTDYVYTDGIQPTIENGQVIVRNGESDNLQSTFKITFNELIMRQSDISNYNKPSKFNLSEILKIKDENGTPITDKFTIVNYGSTGSRTTDPSELVIKYNSPSQASDVNQTFTVTMNEDVKGENVYDYKDQNGFDITKIGTYVWPTDRINTMTLAKLRTPYVTDDTLETSSKSLDLSVNFGLNLATEPRYYYAVTLESNTQAPTAQAIMDAVASKIVSPGSPIILYGSKLMTSTSEFSGVLELVTGQVNKSDVFKTGQKIYVFTIDKYGNIIWATDKSDTSKEYIKIKK